MIGLTIDYLSAYAAATLDQQSSSNLGIAEADEAAALLAPQGEAGALQAFEQGQAVDRAQLWAGIETGLQLVVGDHAAQVMDMMQADVAGEPLQRLGQRIVGAAEERGEGYDEYLAPVAHWCWTKNSQPPSAELIRTTGTATSSTVLAPISQIRQP